MTRQRLTEDPDPDALLAAREKLARQLREATNGTGLLDFGGARNDLPIDKRRIADRIDALDRRIERAAR